VDREFLLKDTIFGLSSAELIIAPENLMGIIPDFQVQHEQGQDKNRKRKSMVIFNDQHVVREEI
jgi:hypothetical protein